MRLWLFLAALPLSAQIVATCPAPGTSAVIKWTMDAAHPGATEVRIERNDDSSIQAGGNPRSVLQAKELAIATGNGAATFPTRPGPYYAYIVQENPYWQSKATAFSCISGPPSPPQPVPAPQPTGITIWVDGKPVAVKVINFIHCYGPGPPACAHPALPTDPGVLNVPLWWDE